MEGFDNVLVLFENRWIIFSIDYCLYFFGRNLYDYFIIMLIRKKFWKF